MLYGTEEDRILIDKFIMYPMLLTIFNRDLKIILQSPFKFRQPYIGLLEERMNRISSELFEVRKQMQQRKIKVMDGKRIDDLVEYEIFIRGYREIMRFPNVHLRNKAETLIMEWIIPSSK